VTSATSLVPIGARSSAVTLAASEHFFDAFEACHDLLPKWGEDNVSSRAALELHRIARGGGRWCKKVMYIFIVDLQVRAPEEVFSGWSSADTRKDVLHRTGNDTRFIFRATQGKSFPGGSLTVGKYHSIESIHSCLDMGTGSAVVDGFVLSSRMYGVKVEGSWGRGELGMLRK
jgi:hypothetical protein